MKIKLQGPESGAASRSRPGAPVDAAVNESVAYMRGWMQAGLSDLPAGGAVLALGCDEAFLAPHLSEFAADVTVLDTAAGEMAQLARRFPDVDFLQHNPSSPLPFAHDTFAAIWCSEFLDRIFDPAAALREMHRVLAPGGRLLITVPDHGAVRNVLIALFRWEEHFSPANPRIRHFTRSMLARLVRQAGFEQVRICTGGTVRRMAGALVPRTLFLQAVKSPAAVESVAAAAPGHGSQARTEALPFAGRTHAA
jgi:SAM-dependent methyltransferase